MEDWENNQSKRIIWRNKATPLRKKKIQVLLSIVAVVHEVCVREKE